MPFPDHDRSAAPKGTPSACAARILLVAVACSVIALDQLTKSLAEHFLVRGPVHLFGPVGFRLEYNSGAAFSLGTGLGPALAVLALIAVGAIWFALRSTSSRLVIVAGGLVAGGALGNVTDRVVRHNAGSVVDFVYTRFWPTFNVADSCISIGVVILVWATLRGSSAKESVPSPDPAEGGDPGPSGETGDPGGPVGRSEGASS